MPLLFWSAGDPEVADPLHGFSGELMASYFTFTGGEYDPLESLFAEEYGLMGALELRGRRLA
jgi:hypothetical protein